MNLEKISKKDVKHLGTFDLTSFYNKFLEMGFYDGIKEDDLESRYRTSYKIFKHNDGRPCKITPPPVSPEEILRTREINSNDVIDIEVVISAMFPGGLAVLKQIFPNADYSDKD